MLMLYRSTGSTKLLQPPPCNPGYRSHYWPMSGSMPPGSQVERNGVRGARPDICSLLPHSHKVDLCSGGVIKEGSSTLSRHPAPRVQHNKPICLQQLKQLGIRFTPARQHSTANVARQMLQWPIEIPSQYQETSLRDAAQ